MEDTFKDGLNAIEHTLVMYAEDVVVLPAVKLYEDIPNERIKNLINKCHIYLIGEVPIIDIKDVHEKGGFVCYDFNMAGKTYKDIALFEMPSNSQFVEENGRRLIRDDKGDYYDVAKEKVLYRIRDEVGPLGFKVRYIGQAFGEDGKKNAIERLLSHSTLQKISILGVPDGYRLELVLVSIENGFRLITQFNPFAKKRDNTDERMKLGLDAYAETNEEERVALYEAALIRYFQPHFNTHFVNSFPSTNLVCLKRCYNKDIQAVVAEINYDPFPYQFFSDTVPMNAEHVAHFDIQKEEDRKTFFLNDSSKSAPTEI
jgi:hypothetical protein